MEIINQLGLMAIPLALCSVAVVAIILERIMFFLKAKLFSRRTYGDLRLLMANYENQGKKIRDEFVSIELRKLKNDCHRGVKLLRIIGTLAPLLGLLGTILGIINAFKVIAAHTTHVSPNMIADGLWEAMLTTAAGLMIAIPALLFAHIFTTVAQQRLQKLNTKLDQDSLNIEVKNHGSYISNTNI